MQRNLGGLRGMKQRPDAIFVLDTKKEHIAVTEANKLGIPVVAVVDTNVDPDVVQFPIPGNDDAIRANSLLTRVIAEAVEEGRYIAAKRNPIPAPPQRSAEEDAAFEKAQSDARNAAAQAQAERTRDCGRPSRTRPRRHRRQRGGRRRASRCRRRVEAAAARSRRSSASRRRAAGRVAVDAVPRRRRRRRAVAADAPAETEPPAADTTATTATDTLTRPRPKPKVEHPNDVHRQGCPGPATEHGRRNDGLQEGARSHRWRHRSGQAAPPREGSRGQRQARRPRDNQGLVALKVDGNVGAIVKLKSETDFVAGSDLFKAEAAALVDLVAAKGPTPSPSGRRSSRS